MNEPRQAELLARWLASSGTEAPPPELDPDVVEAIYALRPELAPPPSVTVDDILAGIETGPFAPDAEETQLMPPTPGPRAADNVVPFPVAPSRPPVTEAPASAPRKGGSVWWIGGGVGALAAAAALVLVLGPQQADRGAPVSPAAAPTAAAPAAPAPATIPEVAPVPAVEDAVADAELLPLDAPAEEAQTGAGPAVARAQTGLMDAPIGGAVGGAVAGNIGVAGLPDPKPGPGADADDDAVVMGERDDEAELQAEARASTKEEPNARKSATRLEESVWAPQNTANTGAPAPAAAPAQTRAYADEAPPSSPSGLDAALADAARTADSDPAAAARQLEPWITKGTVAQGQRVALTAARYARDAGDLDRAESIVKAGLARGGDGTPERSKLQSLLAGIQAARE